MSAAARIGAFVAILALVFAAAVGIGRAVGPTNRAAEQQRHSPGHGPGAQFRHGGRVHTAAVTREVR